MTKAAGKDRARASEEVRIYLEIDELAPQSGRI
jgi:hypothetical protein